MKYEKLNENDFKEFSKEVIDLIKDGFWVLCKFEDVKEPVLITERKVFTLKSNGEILGVFLRNSKSVLMKNVEEMAEKSCVCCGPLKNYRKQFLNIYDYDKV